MPNLRFNVSVYLDNPGALPELRERMADLSPAFDAIYRRWVDINEQKFDQSRGGEVGGAQVFEEFWAGLTEGYMKQKHPSGAPKRKVTRAGGIEYPDWLLVRTGALRAAMIDPESLFNDIGPDQATFGTPNDPDLADIVAWQAGPRQKGRHVIFLSLPDMNAIRMILQDYLGMGGDFREMRFEAGLAAVQARAEMESLDAEFNANVEGVE